MDQGKEERRPLLGIKHRWHFSQNDPRRTQSETALYQRKKDGEEAGVGLKKHITLLDSVGIIVGNVIGSGIFISPKGVIENIGSVGACLVIWASMGVYALVQAMCYAELGAVIPRAGGDYAYVYHILGPLPAFLCAWVQMVIVASSANGVIAQTAGVYIAQPFGLECQSNLISIIAVLIILLFAAVNAFSSRWGTNVQVLFSGAKVIALGIIIITGIAMLATGNTQNFNDAFRGTTPDVGYVSLAALDGYFAYKGWELVNTLPEEMINPKRDLPLGLALALTLVTFIYVMTNVAYFTVLNSAQIIASDAVALDFIKRTLGGPTSWLISLGVAFSCMGTVNGSFLSDSRYLFAAGRTGQVPRVFSMIHANFSTPFTSILLLCIISIIYCLIPDVDQLQQYTSLAVQLKILTTLIALIYFRWKRPDIERPIKVPMVIILAVVAFMLLLVGLSVYSNPATIGVGLGIFLLGVPVQILGKYLKKSECINNSMDKITVILQQLLMVVPEDKPDDLDLQSPKK